ncbi:DUF2231 domain-containing protein [Acidimicrobiia bacterium EGI L10123]|uniref:DUF2231 domain-containing protein n=1 Tax=Salinilacustrithrix flava TaxID=2957203 RepID=UPI003D7C2A23|nr:DUF2231 domain-containing protein [Acidimicrobiia bacterium EGI L10123]
MAIDPGHQRAKRPRTVAAGPHGHPFHPVLVTIPIGAWMASLVFDVVSNTSDDPEIFATGAQWLIGIGLVGAVLAAAFGMLDLLSVPAGTTARRTGQLHMVLNLAVTAAFAVSFVLRYGDTDEEVSAGLIVLSAVALAVLGLSGWLGGKLTYRYGVRVVEEDLQADGFVDGH